MEMLDEAVTAIREGRTPDFDQTESAHAEVDLKIAALIPNDYLNDVPLRLELYKRISSASSNESLSEIEIEMIDRFGFCRHKSKIYPPSESRLAAESLGSNKSRSDQSLDGSNLGKRQKSILWCSLVWYSQNLKSINSMEPRH